MNNKTDLIRVVTLTQHELEGAVMPAIASALEGFQRTLTGMLKGRIPSQVAQLATIRDEQVYGATSSGCSAFQSVEADRHHMAKSDTGSGMKVPESELFA